MTPMESEAPQPLPPSSFLLSLAPPPSLFHYHHLHSHCDDLLADCPNVKPWLGLEDASQEPREPNVRRHILSGSYKCKSALPGLSKCMPP